MKLAIEESVLRQALDALIYAKIANINMANVADAITALRTALDNPTPPTNTDSELREAARAVVEMYPYAIEFDRLRKAL